MSDVEYRHFLSKVLDAQKGGEAAWSVQSTGEKVAVALALNRADWLAAMNYTLAEAIERTGPVWIALLPRVVRALDNDA
ncbi:MAG: hypothetical protein Q8N13_16795 [Acidovorax sp.]|jgi:hypothetical protein|nr:hypothetical protein [Acidovorax sp.]